MTMAKMIGVQPAKSNSFTCLFFQTIRLNKGIMANMTATMIVLIAVSVQL